MRILLFTLLLFSSVSAFGQHFNLLYYDIGLGSNRWTPADLLIKISDTVLTYSILESERKAEVDSISHDTIWKPVYSHHSLEFKRSAIEKIVDLIKDKSDQYLFASNPNVMSGAIQKIHIESNGSCTEFSLKNTTEPTATAIIGIINKYLPKDHKIYIFSSSFKKSNDPPLIKKCSENSSKSFVDYLGEEYEYLRQKKN